MRSKILILFVINTNNITTLYNVSTLYKVNKYAKSNLEENLEVRYTFHTCVIFKF